MKNKKLIIVLSIIAVLVLTIGATYAIFATSKTSKNSNLVVGDIYMHYNETNQIQMENAMPSSTYDPTKYFEFTIDGKNTHTKNGALYNIQLVHGDVETNITRIEDKYLNFRLVEVNNNVETVLKDKIIIESINNTTIYSSTIPANTTSEVVHTYRLYMWIDGNVNICGGTQTDGCDYNISDWSKLFASIKVNVNGKYVEAKNFVETIKNRYNESNQDGLVAVNTDGDLASTGDTIREYRYSGIGNYCTYTDGTNDYKLSVVGSTCPKTACLIDSAGIIINGNNDIYKKNLEFNPCTDNGGTIINTKNNQTEPTDSGIRNYVTFNNETWRIVGVFNEENASGLKEERVKLVKDEPISASEDVPITITKGSVTYNIFNSSYTTTKYKYFYWNNPSSTETNLNDWTKAGSMYYLNENYLNSLKNSTIIENMKYYLGNINIDKSPVLETSKAVYGQERETVVCGSDITEKSYSNNCNVWHGNQANWNGKIALLYLSDYGYASNPSNWNKNLDEAYSNGINLNDWMFNLEAEVINFISPSSISPNGATGIYYVGLLGNILVSDSMKQFKDFAIRPTLSLKSQTMISSGTGSINDPYILSEN